MDGTDRFILISPSTFLRSAVTGFFKELIDYGKAATPHVDVPMCIGDATEVHIYESLKEIFNGSPVIRIESEGKKADILIRHTKCDLIIECKSALGGGERGVSIMEPKAMSQIWGRLYSACVQCAASKNELCNSGRTSICIIIVADYLTVEAFPFQRYATKIGLLDELNIYWIECFSWSSIENWLSDYSVDDFLDELIRRKKDVRSMDLSEMVSIDVASRGNGHKFEHLEATKKELALDRRPGGVLK